MSHSVGMVRLHAPMGFPLPPMDFASKSESKPKDTFDKKVSHAQICLATALTDKKQKTQLLVNGVPTFSLTKDAKSLLGQGSYGTVYSGEKLGIFWSTPVAFKFFSKALKTNSYALAELTALKPLEHPQILKPLHPQILETSDAWILVTELVAGKPLHKFFIEAEQNTISLSRSERIKAREDFLRPLFRQMIEILLYCFKNNVVHGDIKPDNWLVDSKGKLKLIDFGQAISIAKTDKTNCRHGSFPFASPEYLAGYDSLGEFEVFGVHQLKKSEVWSLGVMLSYLLTGRLAEMQAINKIECQKLLAYHRNLSLKILEWESYGLSNEVINLLRKMQAPKEISRIQMDQLLLQPWFNP